MYFFNQISIGVTEKNIDLSAWVKVKQLNNLQNRGIRQ